MSLLFNVTITNFNKITLQYKITQIITSRIEKLYICIQYTYIYIECIWLRRKDIFCIVIFPCNIRKCHIIEQIISDIISYLVLIISYISYYSNYLQIISFSKRLISNQSYFQQINYGNSTHCRNYHIINSVVRNSQLIIIGTCSQISDLLQYSVDNIFGKFSPTLMQSKAKGWQRDCGVISIDRDIKDNKNSHLL